MKIKTRAFIVLAALNICMALCYVAMSPRGKAPEIAPSNNAPASPPNAGGIIVTDISAGDVAAMALANASGTLGIVNKSEGISVIGEGGKDRDPAYLRSLIYAACHLRAQNRLDNYAIPGAAEIQKAAARFTLVLSGGGEYNFAIFAPSERNSGVYVLLFIERGAVYLISPETAQWFL